MLKAINFSHPRKTYQKLDIKYNKRRSPVTVIPQMEKTEVIVTIHELKWRKQK